MFIYFFYGIRHSQEPLNHFDPADALLEERQALIKRNDSLDSLGSTADTTLNVDDKLFQTNGATSLQDQ